MDFKKQLQNSVIQAVKVLYDKDIENVDFQETRKDFDGDITLVVFSLLRHIKGNPVEIGTKIGTYLKENDALVADFNVVKGFLNLVIKPDFFIKSFATIYNTSNFGLQPITSKEAVMVEYSSPNTNKPLHLGHIRNNLLGYAVAEIIKASGKKVYKTQIINDRGIHICKS
ncbi:MAG TPA: arginine--tRNA ligase, partial [Flavobacteriia bacterium]|nr:arginine--tRNA ligase [Flavobacteriia bacterium]